MTNTAPAASEHIEMETMFNSSMDGNYEEL
jgi:hypothetical protein